MSNPSNVSAPLTPLRVLIVEDETLVGVTITEQLKKLGHTVVGQAASAAEALQLFAQHKPDLVLLDVRLDSGDGIELARELLRERRCPMIVISAFSDPELIRRAGDAGVFGYLIKPVSTESLAAQIEVAVRRFREQSQLMDEKDALTRNLETRKLVERAKGILMTRLNLSESDAHRRMQTESQKRRLSMAELAKKIIESEELLGG